MEDIRFFYGLFAIIGFLVSFQYIRKTAGLRLPPGPAPLPVVGNIRDLPPKGCPEYRHWLKHKDLYGPISSVTVMGQTMVVIHDRRVAYDLLEKNSLKTPQRPSTEMVSQIRDLIQLIPNHDYDSLLRRYRKLFHQQMGTKKLIERFQDAQEFGIRRFLSQVLDRPEGLLDHVKTGTGAIILRMTYGYSTQPDGADPLIQFSEHLIDEAIRALTPGTWLVDAIPILKYLPKGFPGTGYRKMLQKVTNDFQNLEKLPYEFVQRQMNNGVHRHSFVSRLIEESSWNTQESDLSSEVAIIKATAVNMYAAAVETTSSTLMVFLLAMVKFPGVQRRAQEEIERVVGTDRLPSFEDRENLPYIEAVIMEALRWAPSFPMGFPHMTNQDIIVQGYLLPKGACILPALYWFTHDPEVYANPDSYEPERYLEPRNEPDPRSVVFGYGRRICPGRYFAEASLYLAIAQTLAVFDMGKAVDEQGIEIEPELKPTPGLVSHPEPFPYKVTPRSMKHAELVRKIKVDVLWEEGDAKHLNLSSKGQ